MLIAGQLDVFCPNCLCVVFLKAILVAPRFIFFHIFSLAAAFVIDFFDVAFIFILTGFVLWAGYDILFFLS